MFIQTEATPNPATLKFLPGKVVMEHGTAEFRDSEEAAAGSTLAARLSAGFRVAILLEMLTEDYMIPDDQAINSSGVGGARRRKHTRPSAGVFRRIRDETETQLRQILRFHCLRRVVYLLSRWVRYLRYAFIPSPQG